MNELQKKILAILFASGDPIGPERIADALDITPEDARKVINSVGDRLEELGMPFELLPLGEQYQLATGRKYAEVILAALDSRRSAPLTQASLEVLAIVAYNQPVTRAFIEQVRGVDSSSIVTNLTSKGLICEVDRLEIPGRPIAFGTTALFMRTFGISSLSELPDPARFAAEAVKGAQEEAEKDEPDGEEQSGQMDFDV